ncbi:MAG: hypothetical protein IJL14_06205 [Selenomonadaceae bacterium]|nr:hypothetical protein [Selenomonadaceae bacterium]
MSLKKFFAAAIVLLMLTAQVEAVPFTRTQLDKIFLDVEQVQADSTLNLNTETFKDKFNGLIKPILQQAMGTDDVSAMEYLFLIKDYKIFSKPTGDTFANMFGDYRVAVVGTIDTGGNFKALSFCYTTPEEKDESIFTVWLITAFVKSIAPEVDPQTLMNELTAENSSGTVITGGIKFSIADESNLNVLTAVSG